MMPTVSPARMSKVTSERMYSLASWEYLNQTWSKETAPCSTWMSLASSSVISGTSSMTSMILVAEARDLVSMRKTLEIIIREFKICMT